MMEGPLGIPTLQVGELAQAVGRLLIDRGFDEADVRRRLLDEEIFTEADWWERAAVHEAIDALAELLGYPDSYPQEVT